MTNITFNNIFGAFEVGQIVEKFDFSKIDLHDGSQNSGLVIRLAPTYGTLDKKSLGSLDDDTKILIAVATKHLHSIPKGLRNWGNAIKAFLKSDFMQPAGEPELKSDLFVEKESQSSLFQREQDTGHKKGAAVWLKRFLTECNILADTRLDPHEIGALLAQPADETKGLLGGTKNHSKKIVDITGIRLPNANQKFLTIYRIVLDVNISVQRTIIAEKIAQSLSAKFTSYSFKPQLVVLKELNHDTRCKIIGLADGLFSS